VGEVPIGAVFHTRPLTDPNHDFHELTAVLRIEWKKVVKERRKNGGFIISFNNFHLKE
jgi:hypothetical protein